MTRISDLDVRAAMLNPEAAFDSPANLADAVGLTRGQRLSALDRWAFSVRARVDAVSEGMTAHPEGAYSRDVELLRDIEQWRETLSRKGDAGAGDGSS